MRQSLRVTIPLKKRKILKKTFHSVIRVLVFSGFVSIFVYYWLNGTFGELPDSIAENKPLVLLSWIGIIALLILSRTFYQILYFLTYFYDMDENNVIIRKGVISKQEITLPFTKITDVYVEQDLLDVAFGLYDVYISTPTVESGRFAHIDGLNKAGSVQMRKLILDSINRADDNSGRAAEGK